MQTQKKGQAEVAVEILVIILFVMVVLYPIAKTTTSAGTTLVTVVNETLDLGTGSINGTTTTLAHFPHEPTNGLTIIAAGKATPTTPINYTFVDATGVITWNSTAASGNITATNRYWNASYIYQPAGYDTNASNRVLLTVITTIILVVGVMLLIGKIQA